MIEWYESGERSIEVNYKNEKLNGLETEFYKTRRKKSVKHYKNGLENGLRTEWSEDGKKIHKWCE